MTQTRRIALFLRATDNDYQDRQREACLAAATRYRLSVRELNARNDEGNQARQIQECLRDPPSIRPRIMLVNPVREAALSSLARDAASLGVGWVSLNRSCDYLQELRRNYPQLPFFSVDPDQRQIGRLQGQQVKILLPKGGNLFYIQGPSSTSSAQLRLAGLHQELVGTRIQLMLYQADWSIEGGDEVARNWLTTLTDTAFAQCVVAAQNDSMAMGARKALHEAPGGKKRFESVRFTGVDGSPTYGHRLVLEEQLAATVSVPPTAGRAVEVISSVLDGARPPTLDVLTHVTSFPDLDALIKVAHGKETRAMRPASPGAGRRRA
jgi:ribose transport system substrate-binding protein